MEEHLDEQAPHPAPGQPGPHPAHHGEGTRHRRWARKVSDVMTTTVVSVDRITPFQEIDRLLTERRISGVPVLTIGRQVAAWSPRPTCCPAEDERARHARMGRRRPPLAAPQAAAPEPDRRRADDRPGHHHQPGRHHPGRRAADEHAPRQEAPGDRRGRQARGIVSRRDLLSVFLRPDADIIHDTRQVLDELALTGPGDVTVTVKHGVVTLTGTMQPEPGQDQDLRPLALQLIWDINSVVGVVNKLGEAKAANGSKPAKTA